MALVLHVVPRLADEWVVADDTLAEDGEDTYPTAEAAAAAARERLLKGGGGELVIHASDGQVRDKEIIGVVDVTELDG